MKRTLPFRSRLLGSASTAVLALSLCGLAATGAQAAVGGLSFAGFDAAILHDGAMPSPFVFVDDDGDDDDDDDDDNDDDEDDSPTPPSGVRTI